MPRVWPVLVQSGPISLHGDSYVLHLLDHNLTWGCAESGEHLEEEEEQDKSTD
jgi:hypothetical protein